MEEELHDKGKEYDKSFSLPIQLCSVKRNPQHMVNAMKHYKIMSSVKLKVAEESICQRHVE
jgi:hypothetical protein